MSSVMTFWLPDFQGTKAKLYMATRSGRMAITESRLRPKVSGVCSGKP
jgi:hypothetical protein